MDKKKIIEKIIEKLRIDIEELEKNYERVREVVITAPGAMQSASDTTRMTESVIADKLQTTISEKREAIFIFETFFEDETDSNSAQRIQMGSLVKVENGGEEQYFFLLPKVGGLKIEIDGKNITTLTLKAPMSQAILDKKIGDKVEINIAGIQRKIEVLEIF